MPLRKNLRREDVLSYARAHAPEFNIDAKMFSEYDLHVHVQQAALLKTGPSRQELSQKLTSLLLYRPLASVLSTRTIARTW